MSESDLQRCVKCGHSGEVRNGACQHFYDNTIRRNYCMCRCTFPVATTEAGECMLLSEPVLAREWDTLEEDEAWKNLAGQNSNDAAQNSSGLRTESAIIPELDADLLASDRNVKIVSRWIGEIEAAEAWEVRENKVPGYERVISVCTKGNLGICRLDGGGSRNPNVLAEVRAKARLIAAALALYEALQEFLRMVGYALNSRDALLISKTCATWEKAANALALASGQDTNTSASDGTTTTQG